ncbi:DEAD/DEAH box helicase [Aquabacterium sp.]|uniref:DEAD/DEAH box helicase n=2 Tax=Pseudomonadota TaxID=1224 RepID=UPI0035C6E013
MTLSDTIRFRPRLTLQTLGRGDGLLGLAPSGVFGPRGGQVTVAWVEWVYTDAAGAVWSAPAAPTVLGSDAAAGRALLSPDGRTRPFIPDHEAEADALLRVRALGLRPVPAEAFQWRAPVLAAQLGLPERPAWSLPQEDAFGDLWAEQVPLLQREGWQVVVRPGFAHQGTAVSAWRLVVRSPDGAADGWEPADVLPLAHPHVERLSSPRGMGSWMVSLGVEVDGQVLDLAPMLADLIRRDRRWLDARQLDGIDPLSRVRLRAPGGRQIEAPAAPLKAIVVAMLDLLLDRPKDGGGGLPLTAAEAVSLPALAEALSATQSQRAGPEGAWALQGDAGLARLAARLKRHGTPPVVPAPSGLGITLRPYQCHGLAWLQHLRAQGLGGILADDMGLGKTAQALAHILTEHAAGRLDRPALVVAPTSLLHNWASEARRMTPSLRVLVWHGADRRAHEHALRTAHLVLTSYPLLWRDAEVFEALPVHLLLLDEAQTVKNAASRAAAAVRRVPARHRLCLTGTPLENHLGELWAQFDFLMPGFLGDWRSFQRRWRDPIEKNGESVRAQLLAGRVRPFILRRRKADVAAELPPCVDVVQEVELEGPQRRLYETVRVAADHLVQRALARHGFDGARLTVLDALLRLRQVCCDPSLLPGAAPLPGTAPRAKLDWLRLQLPLMLESGRRILVFSQFTGMLDLVRALLEELGCPPLSLTGSMPAASRADQVARFQAREVPVMLLSLKAGGVGLNLTAADTVIHLDPWWNPAAMRQATDRAHRIGQTEPVTAYHLVVAGSIETRMLALQQRKAILADAILGHDTALADKFDAEDLVMLLAPLGEERADVRSPLPPDVTRVNPWNRPRVSTRLASSFEPKGV